jgi:hypothetical protein
MLIQDPNTYKNKACGVPKGAIAYPSSAYGERSRAAIYASKNLNLIELASFCNRDICTVMGKIAGKSTIIVSIYLDILHKKVIPPVLDKIMEYSDQY